MKRIPELPVEVQAGGRLEDILCQPLQPYAPETLAYLTALSQRLMASASLRTHPDVAAFAYWCRRSNLARLSRGFTEKGHRLGRGLVFHIAPSNVPVNFAFSLAFGMLAGNANIVRTPWVLQPQVTLIASAMQALFDAPEHSRIAAMTRLVRYPRNDQITEALSQVCHARMLWGGDATIGHLRAMRTAPRCVDIAFADRYSLCVLGAQAVLDVDERRLADLTVGFYNDVFFLDQNACSSPHLVVWLGAPDTVESAMRRFWGAVHRVLDTKAMLAPIHAIDKYVHLCRTAVTMPECIGANWQDNRIHRVRLHELPVGIEDHRGRHGFFLEYAASDLGGLKAIVGERYQTLTCFGVMPDDIIQFIVREGLTGIDRVVPVGKALDMGTIWDGYDLIASLSRVIANA